MEMTSVCTKHQEAVGGFTVLYNYEEGENSTCPICMLQAENKWKDKKIESLIEEKFTLYGDGYGFLATDNSGQEVWVNSTSIALEQKDEEIKQLQAENKRLKKENRWIPVSERLPEKCIDVLVCTPERDYGWTGFYTGIGDDWRAAGTGELKLEVTHWKPIILPEQTLKDKQ